MRVILLPGVFVEYYDTGNFGGHTFSEKLGSLSLNWRAAPALGGGGEPFDWRFSAQTMSARVCADLTPDLTGGVSVSFLVRASGPVAVYLVEGGKSWMVADAWDYAGVTRLVETVDVSFDGISAPTRFVEGPTVTLQESGGYSLVIVHESHAPMGWGGAIGRHLQVAMKLKSISSLGGPETGVCT